MGVVEVHNTDNYDDLYPLREQHDRIAMVVLHFCSLLYICTCVSIYIDLYFVSSFLSAHCMHGLLL